METAFIDEVSVDCAVTYRCIRLPGSHPERFRNNKTYFSRTEIFNLPLFFYVLYFNPLVRGVRSGLLIEASQCSKARCCFAHLSLFSFPVWTHSEVESVLKQPS